MSSTQLTNSDLSEPKEVDIEEVKPKDSNEPNDISTLNAQDQEVQSEEIQKNKVLDSGTITEERKNLEKENVIEGQQKNVDNHDVSNKNESNQEEQVEENLTSNDVNTNETQENKDQSTLSVWSAVWDDNVQGYYYWNTLTNETTWENPHSNNLMGQNINHDYSHHDYYYSQYGYYPEAYYYGYDHSVLATSSDMATTTAVPTTEPPTNPLESILDRIDKEVKTKLDGNSSKTKKTSSTSNSQYNDQQDQIEHHEKDETYEGVEQTSLISSSADLDPYYDQNQATSNDSDYQSFLAEHGGNDSGEYKVTARFNARTGKFQRDPTLNPEKFSADSKAIRQMSYFFDYDQFAESRGSSASNKRLSSDASLGDSIKSPKKLNKKDIEMFKQKKKEKKDMKKKSWLLSDD